MSALLVFGTGRFVDGGGRAGWGWVLCVIGEIRREKVRGVGAAGRYGFEAVEGFGVG